MPLNAGDKLGPYHILERIGAGGMGEVYKARDTRLDRTVAVKLLAERFSERFQLEAKAIASLNHPNICTLHDVGPDYLVMEYIEGKELKGPLPIADVLRLGSDIAAALSHAHRHGVIHRDLKPANILITRAGAKVLDFGLAKLGAAEGASSVPEKAAGDIQTRAITLEGMILGTPSYMAPEQIEGETATARTDIFAFGLVLYEMVTGQPAFKGKTPATLIAAILASNPTPVTAFDASVPPGLDHLIRTCLAKHPDDRRQCMHDILLELKWMAAGATQPGVMKPLSPWRKRREQLSWVAAGTLTAALMGVSWVHLYGSKAALDPVRFEQALPPNTSFNWFDTPEISPDGRKVVFSAALPGEKPALWLRRLDSLQTVRLAGGEDASSPFWSPDSRSVAYFASGKLKKVDIEAGASQVLSDVGGSSGGSWSPNGVILVGSSNRPIRRLPASGGEPQEVLKLDASRGERGQAWPHFLPDGHFLYTSRGIDSGQSAIYLASLESKEGRRLLVAPSGAKFVEPDHLLFGRGTTLFTQRFHPDQHALTGEPSSVADGVFCVVSASYCNFSASRTGVFAFRPHIIRNSQPFWYSRSGKRLGAVGEPRAYRQFTLSPDERWVGAQIIDRQLGTDDLWLLDLVSGVASRFTSDPKQEDTVAWSPDGREIIFGSSRDGRVNLFRKVVGGGDEQKLLQADESNFPAQWLKDGSLIFLNRNGKSFFRLPLSSGAKPQVLLKTEYSKDGPRVSPDGRWIVYNTNESGRWEVYIASFPDFNQRRQVSNGGGVQGHWHKDMKELYYLALDGRLMSVPVKLGLTPETGAPEALFQTGVLVSPASDQFAVKSDGRFLVLETEGMEASTFTVVLNALADVKN